MDHLSIVAQVSIVAGAALAGPLVTFLLALLIAILLRSTTAAGAPPGLALAVANRVGGLVRTRLSRPAVARESERHPIPRGRSTKMTSPAPSPQ